MTSKQEGDGPGSDDAPRPSGDEDEQPVPRLPRSLGFKLSTPAIVRILMTAALLAMILVARRPCADSVSEFVTDFDKVGSGAPKGRTGDQMPKPGRVDVAPNVESTGSAGDYETLRADMTEEELKAAIERAKARAGAGSGMGSAAGSAAGSGSGARPDAGGAPR